MNTYQSPKVRQTVAQRFPVTELRAGHEVALAADSHRTAKLPANVGQLSGGRYALVESVTHAGDGKIRVLVKHRQAPHPSGGQVFLLDGNQTVVAKRPASVVAEAKPVGAAQ